mgnify:CR=1 FL=1
MQYRKMPLLPDVVRLEPEVHYDTRGSFHETFRQADFAKHCGSRTFVQDNHIHSYEGVLRGLHYNPSHPQGKLVRVARGEIFDVAVDMREGSPTFGKWVGAILSSTNKCQLWIPEGFAHGFVTLSSYAEVTYKATDYYQDGEVCLDWKDADLNINWILSDGSIRTSDKDSKGLSLETAPTVKLSNP